MDDRRSVQRTNSPDDDRRSFYRHNKTVKFSKGETIFLQGETPKFLYSIKNGVVEESNLTSGGNQQSIAFEIIGDIIPKSWAFSKTDTTLFDYTAFTDCELYVINREDFLSQLAFNMEFIKKIMSRLIISLMGAKLKLDAIEKPYAGMKLVYTFRYLCIQYGTNVDSGSVMIQVPLTQQDLADFTGLTRETTNLELNKLKKERIVTSDQKYYTVDIEKLNSKVDDEYAPDALLNMLPQKK
ncbi:MAG TPA: Crp/Fnr family transcriptional regulator [Candidatus Saccharimonadales bacterium]|nr:Crp/Fnr family transcriptional regulator [Candidatus Saccharimonadales bacterium]